LWAGFVAPRRPGPSGSALASFGTIPMLRLGSYELLREIHRSKSAVVYAARRADDEADAAGRYAVKAFDADSYGLLESVASAHTFLERAALQAALSTQGARHWAAIHEAGDTDTPFFVTDLYPLSARKVVDRGAAVGPRGLYTIVWSVVRGLTEMREMFRRAHGNLKLTNVLIRGEDLRTGTPKTTEVVLVDPSVEAHSARDRSADLYAVGELIHQLVLKRPSRPTPGPDDLDPPLEPDYPIPYTTAWRKLGPQGEGWLDLCNWLLSPDPSDRPPDLVAVAVALHQLAPAPSRRARKWVAAAGALALAGGAGAAALHHANGTARAELSAVNQQWFAAFERALDDPARQQRYAADDTLNAVTALVRQAKQAGVHFDPSNDSMFSYPAYRNAQAAAEVAQRVERELTPERWQRLAAQNALRQTYAARGWTQPAMFVADLTAAARPGTTADLAAGVDRLMNVTSRIGPAAAALDEQWARYEADLKVAQDANDPVLTAFARSLRESVGTALRLTDGGFDGLDALADRQPLAARLAAVVRGGFPQEYGRDRIAAEVESKLNTASPTPPTSARGSTRSSSTSWSGWTRRPSRCSGWAGSWTGSGPTCSGRPGRVGAAPVRGRAGRGRGADRGPWVRSGSSAGTSHSCRARSRSGSARSRGTCTGCGTSGCGWTTRGSGSSTSTGRWSARPTR
jgi:hypothetical protein